MAGQLTGTVWDAVTRLPIPGATVHLFDTTTNICTTEANGVYLTCPFPGGTYYLSVSKTGYEPSAALPVQIKNELIRTFDIYLVPKVLSGSLDAYKDQRVAQLYPRLSWRFKTSNIVGTIIQSVTGSGNISVLNGKAILATGMAADSSAEIKSAGTLVPTAGEGVIVRIAARFSAGVAGNIQLIGIGDESDGFFYGFNGSSFGILHRQNGIEQWIPQNQWNIEHVDGTSAFALDPTKGNNYVIHYQPSGYGNIEFSVEDPASGFPLTVHIIRYGNANINPSLFNSNLPLYAKVKNSTNDTYVILETPSSAAFIEGITEGETPREIAARMGNLYEAATDGVPVPANGFLCIQITHLSGTGKSALIHRVTGSGIKPFRWALKRNASFVNPGTSLTPRNMNFEFPDTSSLTVKYISQSTDPSVGGSLLASRLVTGGSLGVDYNGSLIIPSGYSFLMQMKNLNSHTVELSANITWVEFQI